MKFRWETEFKKTEIGEIPKDWEVRKLGEISEIKGGKRLPKGEFLIKTPNNHPYIRVEDIIDGKINIRSLMYVPDNIYPLIERYRVFEGDIIISIVGTIGLTAYIDKKVDGANLTENAARITHLKDAVPKFIKYYLESSLGKREIEANVVGSTQPKLPLYGIKNIRVLLPSLHEQHRIATILSWFDDLIENKRKQNEILENMAMAIFKSWFIDFEPFQDEEFVYSEELDMEIPEGWEVKPIGEVAEFTNGLSYQGKEKFDEFVDGSYVFITLNNIQEGGGFKFEYSWIKSNRIKDRHYVREGELIIANTEQTKTGRLLGTPAFVVFPNDYRKNVGVYSHHITKVVPIEEHLKTFLYLIFRFYQKDIANSYHTGTGVWGFDVKSFKDNFLIISPPQPILQRFHSLVEPLFQKIILNQKQILTLMKIRDILLPQLVFGRLRVEEI